MIVSVMYWILLVLVIMAAPVQALPETSPVLDSAMASLNDPQVIKANERIAVEAAKLSAYGSDSKESTEQILLVAGLLEEQKKYYNAALLYSLAAASMEKLKYPAAEYLQQVVKSKELIQRVAEDGGPELRQGYIEYLRKIAYSLNEKGYYDLAIEFMNEALSKCDLYDPNEATKPILKSELAYSFLHKNNYDQAIKIYDELVIGKHTPVDTKLLAMTNLSYIYSMKGDIDKTVKASNLILDLKEGKQPSDDSEAYDNIGVVYMKNKKYKEAKEYFNKALENLDKSKSSLGIHLLHLAEAQYYTNDKEQACKTIQQIEPIASKYFNASDKILFQETKSRLELCSTPVSVLPNATTPATPTPQISPQQ